MKNLAKQVIISRLNSKLRKLLSTYDITIVTVTGSIGKTTTKQAIGQVLELSLIHISTKETVFSPAITLMPRTWNNNAWSANGKSSVSQIENNTIVCTGTNPWQANVIGREEIASGVQAIHVRSKQTIRWTSGRSSSGCAAGYTTNWQEDYYLLSNLPKDSGGTAKAMKRTIGGNKDVPSDRWDIWFDLWKTLPGK